MMVVGCVREGLMEMDQMKVEIRWGNGEKMADLMTRMYICGAGRKMAGKRCVDESLGGFICEIRSNLWCLNSC